jgi:hypothetical protein
VVCGVQVTLVSRFNGVGYTFVLAGFLKIVTVGGLTLSAPTDVARTAFGKATPYLMIPVGLGMCWVAKQVCTQLPDENCGTALLNLLLVKCKCKAALRCCDAAGWSPVCHSAIWQCHQTAVCSFDCHICQSRSPCAVLLCRYICVYV